jgi:hypothetical protein
VRRGLAPAALVAALGVAAAAPASAATTGCPTTPAFDPAVPTWEAVNGFALGSRPATNDEIAAYVAAVDRASPRVAAGVAGPSIEGRQLVYAIVSAPAALTPRRMAALSGALRAVRRGSAAERSALRAVQRGPAVVWLAAGAHGDEPSGSDADMRVLHELAARTDCANRRRLRRLVTVILPLQNPDGRAASSRANAAGFDLNRDWFAGTQPETAAKLALMQRLPPVLLADQHEEAGASFFFPPNADPVHHEISRQSLAAINDVAAPALRRAFDANGVGHVAGGPYDLFFMGYGDTVSTTRFGAGGMTFEQGRLAPSEMKVAHHALAAGALLDVAAGERRRLVAGWAQQWRAAARQGAGGRLQPNLVLNAGNSVQFPVPPGRVHAYALRADRHAADAAALVARLRAAGVVVRRLRAPWRAPLMDPYGAAPAGPAALPAGTFIVPLAQGAKHWIQALLGEHSYVPFPYFYDVSAWSNPLVMGLAGGTLRTRVAARRLRPIARGELDDGAAPAAGAAAYGFAGDSEGALALATALLARGVSISRIPRAGDVVVPGAVDHAMLRELAAARRVPLRALAAAPAGAVALRTPRVALLALAPGPSAGWLRHVVERRLGLSVDQLDSSALEAGRLTSGGYTALIVPDGGVATGTVSPPALLALQAWVRAGGTYVGVRGAGVAVAEAAGLTSARLAPPSLALKVPGASLGVLLDDGDPVAWGMGRAGFAFNNGDPVLAAGGAHAVARYPGADGFFVSGYAEGTSALHGTPALLREGLGAGHVVLFAFDPAFRAYAEGTQRLLANALLIPRPSAAARAAAARRARRRPVDPARLVAATAPARDSVVEVAAQDAAALLAAAADAGAPPTARVQRDVVATRLVVPNPGGYDVPARGWPQRMLAALAAAGVRPLYAAF